MTHTQLDFRHLRESFNLHNNQDKLPPENYNCYNCQAIDSIKSIRGVNCCVECGDVKGEDISQEMECQYSGMAMGDNSSTARSGMSNNNLVYQSNFNTKIVGNHMSYGLKQKNNVWDSLTYKERALLSNFKKITGNCRQSGVPNNVISFSHVLYTQFYEKQKTIKIGKNGSRADNLVGVLGGCIYYSCKGYGINRSHQEISEICGTTVSVISYGCKLVFRLLHKEINLNQNQTTYRDFLERYSSHLILTPYESKIVKEICEIMTKLDLLSGNKPSTLAAVGIYFANNIYNFDLDKHEISEKCHTTEATLAKNYKILLESVVKLII